MSGKRAFVCRPRSSSTIHALLSLLILFMYQIHVHTCTCCGSRGGLSMRWKCTPHCYAPPLFFLEVGRKRGGGGQNSVAVRYNNARHCSAVAVVNSMLREEGLIYTFKDQVFKGQMGCVQRGKMSRSACTYLTRANDITRTYVKTWFRLRTLHCRLLPLDQRSARLYSHQHSTDGSTRHNTLPTTIRTALQVINVCYP